MKRLLILAILLTSSQSFADCFEFELLGEGLIEKNDIKFIVAKKTQSQVKLTIPRKDQDLFSPYLNRWARARLILDRDYLNYSTQVIKAIAIDYEVPDPLNMNSKTSINKIGKIECPKI
ncbi:MAG TPA: hypothetical protein VKZ84_03685 [Bacteriovoracaceae bacterium]|nr:hypothetical protein [Bacteriovoracaceae bacterium]